MVKGQKVEKQVEKFLEKTMEEEGIEEKEEETIMNIISNEVKSYIYFRLDTTKLKGNDFINLAISRVGLKDMFKAKPTQIYPVVVLEFFGNLDTKSLIMMISCTNPNTYSSYKATVNVKKLLLEKLKLPNSG